MAKVWRVNEGAQAAPFFGVLLQPGEGAWIDVPPDAALLPPADALTAAEVVAIRASGLFRFQAAQVAALQQAQVAQPYTWATLPAPADYIGTAFVSDIGPKGSLWRSDGATWGPVGGLVLLDRSAVALPAHTGTTALTTLLTRSLPAGLPGPNGAYRWRGKVTTTNNGSLKTLFAYFGGSAATGIGYVSQAGGGFDITIENRGSASSQIGSNGSASGMGAGAWTTGLAINTAAAHDVSLRCTLANSADSLVIEAWQLELIRP